MQLTSTRILCLWVALSIPGYAVAPAISNVTLAPSLAVQSQVGGANQIQYSTDLGQTNWTSLTNAVVTRSPFLFADASAPAASNRFYRVAVSPMLDKVLIPAGDFVMGDNLDGDTNAQPVHTVSVSAFYMDQYQVTKALWDAVSVWAVNSANPYSFDYGASGKTGKYPAQTMTWYDAAKWCNARSEYEGKTPAYYVDAGLTVVYRAGLTEPFVQTNAGYRLPTEAEWEKAARGGLAGKRFPWGDTIDHSQANYLSLSIYPYDVSSDSGYYRSYNDDVYRSTSPTFSFAPNGYGLYDMAGNVWEWCFDWHDSYASTNQVDPSGPASGTVRVLRGGGWNSTAFFCRTANRSASLPVNGSESVGFRTVLSPTAALLNPTNVVAPVIKNITLAPRLAIVSPVGATNQIQFSEDAGHTNWAFLANIFVTQSPFNFVDQDPTRASNRTYRVIFTPADASASVPLTNMALIPAGNFTLGDNLDGDAAAQPTNSVYVSAFYMDKYLVTEDLWRGVYNWAITNSYFFDYQASGKATNHPAFYMNWYDSVKWCNARSEMEGRKPAYYVDAAMTVVYRFGEVAPYVKWGQGYRLPTEAEWERAARGGVEGARFANGTNSISQDEANFFSAWWRDNHNYAYDTSSSAGYHPAYSGGESPYTSPVGTFPPNGYGLYDMTGNLWEWCWDWYASGYFYEFSADPSGLSVGSIRVLRGGSWFDDANACRVARRNYSAPAGAGYTIGFRTVLPSAQ